MTGSDERDELTNDAEDTVLLTLDPLFSAAGSEVEVAGDESESGMVEEEMPTRTVSHMLPSGYSLTWPIWHLLPLSEKLRIARNEGLTVGEFEESVALQMAIEGDGEEEDGRGDDSLVVVPSAHSPALDVEFPSSKLDLMAKHREKLSRALGDASVLGEDKADLEDDEGDDEGGNEGGSEGGKEMGYEERVETGFIFEGEEELGGLFLPIDIILHRLFPFLQCEMIAHTLPLLSTSWTNLITPQKHLSKRTKAHGKEIWQDLCRRRFYPSTGIGVPVKLPPKFSSYKAMFQERLYPKPHGIYILKHSYVKKITRDMWTSSNLPPGVILKGEWYRYFLFTEGEERMVGYLQSSKTFKELKSKFRRWYVKERFCSPKKATGEVVTGIVTGRYDVFRGGKVRVMVSQSWADIFFELELSRSPKNLHMSMMRHYAVINNSTGGDNDNVVKYDTPSRSAIDNDEGWFRYDEDKKSF